MRNAIILSTALAAACAGGALAQDKAPVASAERGAKLYVDLACHSCHGTHGQGGGRNSEPKIRRPLLAWSGYIGLLRKPPRDMPAYTHKWVSDQEAADMYAYLTSLKPVPAVKDIPLLNQM